MGGGACTLTGVTPSVRSAFGSSNCVWVLVMVAQELSVKATPSITFHSDLGQGVPVGAAVALGVSPSAVVSPVPSAAQYVLSPVCRSLGMAGRGLVCASPLLHLWE